MRVTDRNSRPECSVIPFHRPELEQESLVTTSIAAVIAVTILHTDDISPEDRLMEIIEASGEAEILDADEVFTSFDESVSTDQPVASNDNKLLSSI